MLTVGDVVVVQLQGVMWVESNPWDPFDPNVLRSEQSNGGIRPSNLNQVVMWERPADVAVVLERRIPTNDSRRRPWVKLLMPNGKTGWSYEANFKSINE